MLARIGQAANLDAGAGAQAAHGAAAEPGAVTRFQRFHGQAPVAFGFAGRGEGVGGGLGAEQVAKCFSCPAEQYRITKP